MNAVEKLTDPHCDEDIVLYDEQGNERRFAQVAFIPLAGKKHAILRPLFALGEMENDQALVFTVVYFEGEETLLVETDDAVVDRVFDEYNRLYAQHLHKEEREKALLALKKEHEAFMAYFTSIPPLLAEMDAFVKEHLRKIPATNTGRVSLALRLAEYRDGLLDKAADLAENRSMLRTLAHYDMALENLLDVLIRKESSLG